ncbi:HAD hydrolase-like protein [uncultured Draconibacterium sp.]|uniref:HAD family hydrolase n=1 Tax=uncultured Draconibacterium sp. TaxID=1573823 RepID=UPI0029C7AA29|nr:HAD hydrolase-like protein [uncultured Draconibacterium sp.]
MQSIIWDWNGTLLNDLDFCISTINVLLKKRQLDILDRFSYKEVFSFPVKDYYEAIGFDFSKEDFSIPAREFIDLYNSGVPRCNLHDAAIEVLEHFKNMGLRQFVLSAMQQDMLEKTLEHQNILHYFKGVAGLNDHYAVSKIERGEQLIRRYSINKAEATIIGDTNHDFEVAQQLEIDCILVADGHQSVERLEATGAKVIEELQQLKTLPI